MVYTDGTHMVADSLNELHYFASSIGLNRCWFSGTRKGHPHYDLKNNKGYLLKDQHGISYIEKAKTHGVVFTSAKIILLISWQMVAKSREDYMHLRLLQLDRLLEQDGYYPGTLHRKILEELTNHINNKPQ